MPNDNRNPAAANGEPPARLSIQVVDTFLGKIAGGELSAGDRLPPERTMAELYGVGRNSVREALRQLELLGLVESRRGAGTYVVEGDSGRLMAPFRTVLALAAATASRDHVLEFRRMLEPEAAALAATNADEAARRQLEHALRRFDQAVDAADRPREADTNFHFAIAQATGNPLIIAVERALLDVLASFRTELSGESYAPPTHLGRGHHAIFGAIVAGDADAARAGMQQHLADVAAALPEGG